MVETDSGRYLLAELVELVSKSPSARVWAERDSRVRPLWIRAQRLAEVHRLGTLPELVRLFLEEVHRKPRIDTRCRELEAAIVAELDQFFLDRDTDARGAVAIEEILRKGRS